MPFHLNPQMSNLAFFLNLFPDLKYRNNIMLWIQYRDDMSRIVNIFCMSYYGETYSGSGTISHSYFTISSKYLH